MKTLPLIAEYLGTFLLTLAYLSLSNVLIITGIFATILFLVVPISGGCLNPAISLAMYLKGHLGSTELMIYIAIQMLAGATSFYIFNLLS